MSPRRSQQATRALRARLLEHARQLVERDGAQALTMRAVAAEAGCAVGLLYKVFASRDELVAELVSAEFHRLRAAFDELVAGAGAGTVADTLRRYARILLETPTPAFALANELGGDALRAAVDAKAGESGLLHAFATTVADYLAAEKRLGRVDPAVDEQAFGFLITGAVHNLLVAGDAYPRPDLATLDRHLEGIAARLTT